MSFTLDISEYLGSDTSTTITPAVLFANSKSSNNFGQIYLFSQFGVAQECSLSMQSQITTHYTEENYAINDHWALAPKMYNISGLIGEVIYTPPTGWASYVESKIPDFISGLSIISPTLDNYTQSLYNVTQQVEAVAQRYQNTIKQALSNIGLLSKLTSKTNQEYVLTQLETLRDNRQLVSVYTPYGTYIDMAIVNISISQSSNTQYSSTLEIQLQQWRDTITIVREATDSEKSALAKAQNAAAKNNGVASTTTVKSSNAVKLWDALWN